MWHGPLPSVMGMLLEAYLCPGLKHSGGWDRMIVVSSRSAWTTVSSRNSLDNCVRPHLLKINK